MKNKKNKTKGINQNKDMTEKQQGIEEAATAPQDAATAEDKTVSAPEKEEEQNLKLQLEEANNRYLRLYSEFENFRKRNAKERLELIVTASEDVITSLLTVLDDFERAIHFNKQSDDQKAIKQGIELIYQKFKSVLTQKGLKEIDAEGKQFDMEQHEAIAKVPVKSKKKRGKIIEVVEKGYRLGEKVIRYPKVVVGE